MAFEVGSAWEQISAQGVVVAVGLAGVWVCVRTGRLSYSGAEEARVAHLHILDEESTGLPVGALGTLSAASTPDATNAALAAYTVSVACWEEKGDFSLGEQEGRPSVICPHPTPQALFNGGMLVVVVGGGGGS